MNKKAMELAWNKIALWVIILVVLVILIIILRLAFNSSIKVLGGVG
jgi:hypothetical protein